MTPVQIKIYGAFSPVGPEVFPLVADAGSNAVGQDEPWLLREGDLLRISLEGVWFPWEDVLEALRTTASQLYAKP